METRIALRHVSCFHAIARERHIGRAAERLHLTQPVVSKTLSKLESLADVRLVERGRHGAHMTPAGEHFLRYAVSVEHSMESAAAALQSPIAPPVKTLEVGALPTVESGVLPNALLRLRNREPLAGVRLHTATNDALLSALKAGRLDCVVGRMAEPSIMQGLSFELLYAEPLVMAVLPQHPLLGKRPVSPQSILAYPLVVAPGGTVPRVHTDAIFDARKTKRAVFAPQATVQRMLDVEAALARALSIAGVIPADKVAPIEAAC